MNIDISGYKKLIGAKTVEDLLCYATLVANGIKVENVQDADDYWKSNDEDCDNCPFVNKCAAVKVNE